MCVFLIYAATSRGEEGGGGGRFAGEVRADTPLFGGMGNVWPNRV